MRKSALILIFFAVLVAWIINDVRHENAAKKASKDKALSFSTLDNNTIKSWLEFLDARFENQIRLSGDHLILKPYGDIVDLPPTYVSKNYPYSVNCISFEVILIDFGAGEEATSVMLTSPTLKVKLAAPTLNFDRESIAAKKLTKISCEHIINKMDTLIK